MNVELSFRLVLESLNLVKNIKKYWLKKFIKVFNLILLWDLLKWNFRYILFFKFFFYRLLDLWYYIYNVYFLSVIFDILI